MASASERLIRDAVVDRLHQELPRARVIHELVCGGNRADLAAVEPERLLLFEIKSEKDVLTRTDAQMATFMRCAHGAVLVAHERWFDKTPYDNGRPRLAWPYERDWQSNIWCFPETEPDPYGLYRWHVPRPSLRQPRAATLLELLWKAELLEEAARHRISVSSRSRCPDIIDQMTWLMTGREIAQAVCRQLRARRFPEADAPILQIAEAAA